MLNHFYIAKKPPTLNFDLGFELNGPNRRKEPRTSCLIPAHYKINRQLYSSFILDINETGAFIETDRSFPAGDKIVLKFLDPYSRRTSLIKGSIAWSRDAAIGVKFNYHLFTPF
jgi:Tfp pilus assembly protein PilZ